MKLIVVMNLTPSRTNKLWNFYSVPKECTNEIETYERVNTQKVTIRMALVTYDANYRCSYTTTIVRYEVWFLIVKFRFIIFCTSLWNPSTCVLFVIRYISWVCEFHMYSNEQNKRFFLSNTHVRLCLQNGAHSQTMKPNIRIHFGY